MAQPGNPATVSDRRWVILSVAAVAQLMVVLDATIVKIPLPSAQPALGFPDSDRQWVVTACALASRPLSRCSGVRGRLVASVVLACSRSVRLPPVNTSPATNWRAPTCGPSVRTPRVTTPTS
jgi:hypothetical protein